MNVLNKKMAKRTGAHGAPAAMVVSSVCSSISISKIVDFIEAGPFGSAFFLCGENRDPQRVILSVAKDLAFIS